jgi:autotransporter translocation and assembly factor TamB
MKGLLAGTLNSKIEFSGAGQTPDAILHSLTLVGLAALTDGRLGPGPALEAVSQFVKVPKFKQLDFSRLELPMRIEHGRLVTDPVVLNGASGEWKFAGALGFDGALDYAVSVTLPPAAVEALGARSALAAGAMSDAQGRMLLDLHVSGSARSPRVSWDTNAMRARLAGRASEALAEQRTKLEADAREAARQALLNRFGVAGDSTAPKMPLTGTAARESVSSAARGLLKNFFGGKKPVPTAPAPAPVLPPPPPPAAVPDTTQH